MIPDTRLHCASMGGCGSTNWITSLYLPQSNLRLQEMLTCISRNLKSGLFESIVLFLQSPLDEAKTRELLAEHCDEKPAPSTVLVPTDNRPTLELLFDYAARNFSEQTVVVSNADIWHDETLTDNLHHLRKDELWTITRHEADGRLIGEGNDYMGSHDTWVFRAPLKSFPCDFEIGTAGCDSYLSQKAIENGVWVRNPARSVICRHLHTDSEQHHQTTSGSNYQQKPDYMSGGFHNCLAPPRKLPCSEPIEQGDPTDHAKDHSWTIPFEISQKYAHLKTFIETGTYRGGGVQQALEAGFEQVHTIERDLRLANAARERFESDSRVNVYLGDSMARLPEIFKTENISSALIVLDAHHDPYGFASERSPPLLQELDSIIESGICGAIIIDDIDMIERNEGWGMHIDFSEVQKRLETYQGNSDFQRADGRTRPSAMLIAERQV